MAKKCEDLLGCFTRILTYDKWTDRHLSMAQSVLCIASRGKNHSEHITGNNDVTASQSTTTIVTSFHLLLPLQNFSLKIWVFEQEVYHFKSQYKHSQVPSFQSRQDHHLHV